MSQSRGNFRTDDNQAQEVISNFTRTLDESMIRSMIECFSIQQGIISVPVFDGENMPVRDFIEDVMNGALVVPADCEKQYFRAVLSCLKDTARSSTYGKTSSNLNELNDHLKQRYAPRKAYSWYISEMATIQLPRGDNVSEFKDRTTSLRLGAQAVLEDKYENDNSHCLLLNYGALEAFIRGLPDRMSAFVESQCPNTSEIALKYALDYETKHQTNSQILQQQNNFNLRDRSRSPREQFTPSQNGKDATNSASNATQHIQIITNTSAFNYQYQCTHTEYNPSSYVPLSQTNEDHLFYHKTNCHPSSRNKIYGNKSAKTEEQESRISKEEDRQIIIIFATPVTPTQYEIQPLRNNPGLFYAKVEPLRITSTYWRIVVYMDPQHLQTHLQSKNISTDINNVYSTCLDQSIEEDCRSEVRVDLLNGKVKQIENNYEELKNILTEIKQDTPEAENPPPSMQKRRAPLLGFIRSIIGPVIGVMTSIDAEEYDNAINELHDRQNNLSRILRKQAYIVKSEINNIHLELNQKTQEIANIQQQLNETIKNIESHNQFWSNIIYFRKIRQWADHIDIKLNHLAESLGQFIKIVEAAREKRLHPLLLNKEQLQEIITEIYFKLSEYEFLIPTSHV